MPCIDFLIGEGEKKMKEGKVEIVSKKSKKESKMKKRKALDMEEERSETSTELGEPVNNHNEVEVQKTKKKSKKEEDPHAVSRFRISQPLRAKLKVKGIESLFPIQAMTFDTIFDGSDMVAQARTGQGKTLAFVLPILESLTNGPAKAKELRRHTVGYGRAPSVVVLLPTRDLAKQVFGEFEFYGGALGLASCCLYGGSPYSPQEYKLKKGVDIVVGTPGRIKDHIDRGNLDLSTLKFRVLDEADQMLTIDFIEGVKFILGKVNDATKVQTLLFSATMTPEVQDIASRFLRSNKKTEDLVGNEEVRASITVRHIVLPCCSSAREKLIPDIVRCYSSGGRSIIFTETKDYASKLAGLLPGAQALHGDIQQAQREVVLSRFRSGKFLTLVATNVASRGLDINGVQLVIQCEPPRKVEDYIHRSGRTGRAGNTGVSVVLNDQGLLSSIPRIERESGVNFERLPPPQPIDVAQSASLGAAEMIAQVSDSVIPAFKSAAEELLNTCGQSAVELLAKALAKTAGYNEINKRSLLTSMENHVAVLLQAERSIFKPSYAYGVLRRFLPEETVKAVKGMMLTADGKGAVFDVAAVDLDMFVAGAENAANVSIEVLEALPNLQEKEARGGRFGLRFGGRGRRDGGFSDRRNDGFSNRSGDGRCRSNYGGNRW